MDCCKTKNEEGCCEDLSRKEKNNFFGFLKRKTDKKGGEKNG